MMAVKTKREIGKGIVLREGGDAEQYNCPWSSGFRGTRSSADELAGRWALKQQLYITHTTKPLDTELVNSLAKKCGAIVTAEDHSVIGGLGGAVAVNIYHLTSLFH